MPPKKFEINLSIEKKKDKFEGPTNPPLQSGKNLTNQGAEPITTSAKSQKRLNELASRAFPGNDTTTHHQQDIINKRQRFNSWTNEGTNRTPIAREPESLSSDSRTTSTSSTAYSQLWETATRSNTNDSIEAISTSITNIIDKYDITDISKEILSIIELCLEADILSKRSTIIEQENAKKSLENLECNKADYTRAIKRIATQLFEILTKEIKNFDLNTLTAAEEAIIKSSNTFVDNINRKEKKAIKGEISIEPDLITKRQTGLENRGLFRYDMQILKDYCNNHEFDSIKLFYHFYQMYKRTYKARSKEAKILADECRRIINQSAAGVNPNPFRWEDFLNPPTDDMLVIMNEAKILVDGRRRIINQSAAGVNPNPFHQSDLLNPSTDSTFVNEAQKKFPNLTLYLRRIYIIPYTFVSEMFRKLESQLKNEGISFYDDQPASYPDHLLISKSTFDNPEDVLSSHMETLTLSGVSMSELTHLSELAPDNTHTLDLINHYLNQIRKSLTYPIPEVSAYIQALKLSKHEQREYIQKQKLSGKEIHAFRESQRSRYVIEKKEHEDQRRLSQKQLKEAKNFTGSFSTVQKFINAEEQKEYLTSGARRKVEEIEKRLPQHIETLTKMTQALADIEIRKNLFGEPEQTARDEKVQSYRTLASMTEQLAVHANTLATHAQEAGKAFQQSEYKDLQNLLKAFPKKAQALVQIIHDHYVEDERPIRPMFFKRDIYSYRDDTTLNEKGSSIFQQSERDSSQTESQERSEVPLQSQVQAFPQEFYQKSRPERAQDLLQQFEGLKSEQIPGWAEEVQKLYEEGWILTGTSRLQHRIDAFLEWYVGETNRLVDQAQELAREVQRRVHYANNIQQTFPDHNRIEQALNGIQREFKEIPKKIKEIYNSIRDDHQDLEGLYKQVVGFRYQDNTETASNNSIAYTVDESTTSDEQPSNLEAKEEENNTVSLIKAADLIEKSMDIINYYRSIEEELDISIENKSDGYRSIEEDFNIS